MSKVVSWWMFPTTQVLVSPTTQRYPVYCQRGAKRSENIHTLEAEIRSFWLFSFIKAWLKQIAGDKLIFITATLHLFVSLSLCVTLTYLTLSSHRRRITWQVCLANTDTCTVHTAFTALSQTLSDSSDPPFRLLKSASISHYLWGIWLLPAYIMN